MDARRSIPSVERLLSSEPFRNLIARTSRALVTDLLQDVQGEVRADPSIQPADNPADWYAGRITAALDTLERPTLRRVINATGVVLHTNLGRAPLAEEAILAIQLTASGYNNLEYDIAKGKRGSRYEHCVRLLRSLTGAEDALLVNNNAAALVLALNTFARGKPAIVSRGELVEIGGSFRVSDIMARSGARLLEVGSTNRTHPADYQDAITPATGALLKVHQSNFRTEGYTADVTYDVLADVAHERGLPLIYDLGSGLLDHATALGLPGEPTARDAIKAGCTIVTLSGDKLLGGPQAGILLASKEHVARMKKNPLCRALRVDKLTIAALEATLRLHLDPERARRTIPVLRMLTLTRNEIAARAKTLVERIQNPYCNAEVIDGVSAVGGGAAPGRDLVTALVRITSKKSAAALERSLRSGAVTVITRIEDDAVLLDLRTVAPAEDALLGTWIGEACK